MVWLALEYDIGVRKSFRAPSASSGTGLEFITPTSRASAFSWVKRADSDYIADGGGTHQWNLHYRDVQYMKRVSISIEHLSEPLLRLRIPRPNS